jgi:hypothetical protein
LKMSAVSVRARLPFSARDGASLSGHSNISVSGGRLHFRFTW